MNNEAETKGKDSQFSMVIRNGCKMSPSIDWATPKTSCWLIDLNSPLSSLKGLSPEDKVSQIKLSLLLSSIT